MFLVKRKKEKSRKSNLKHFMGKMGIEIYGFSFKEMLSEKKIYEVVNYFLIRVIQRSLYIFLSYYLSKLKFK